MSPVQKTRKDGPVDGTQDVVHVYQDAKREWRWRRVAPNGRVIAESGESYQRKRMCRHGFSRATDNNYRITIEGEPS